MLGPILFHPHYMRKLRIYHLIHLGNKKPHYQHKNNTYLNLILIFDYTNQILYIFNKINLIAKNRNLFKLWIQITKLFFNFVCYS